MTLTQRARAHNAAAFEAELKATANIYRTRGDFAAAYEIERAITCNDTNDYTETVARRFVTHGRH